MENCACRFTLHAIRHFGLFGEMRNMDFDIRVRYLIRKKAALPEKNTRPGPYGIFAILFLDDPFDLRSTIWKRGHAHQGFSKIYGLVAAPAAGSVTLV
jgi:hypothetical protein